MLLGMSAWILAFGAAREIGVAVAVVLEDEKCKL